MLSGPGTSGSQMYSNAGEVKMPSLTTKTTEHKGPKRKKEAEATAVPDYRNFPRKEDNLQVEDSESPWCPSPAKPDSALTDNVNVEELEKVLNEMNKEINFFLGKFAQILSERTAVDSSYIHEFDEIIKEARGIETQLKQKRESLRNRLTMIANTLQR